MYQAIGALLIVGTVATLFVMSFRKMISGRQIAALGIIGLSGGMLIPNLTVVSKFQMSSQGAIVETERTVVAKANEVETLAAEVRQIESRVKASENKVSDLVSEAEQTKRQAVESSHKSLAALQEAKNVERNLTIMQTNLRQTWRSMFPPYLFLIGEVRSIWGIRKDIHDEINTHLNLLAEFAYPDADERVREINKIKDMMPGSLKK